MRMKHSWIYVLVMTVSLFPATTMAQGNENPNPGQSHRDDLLSSFQQGAHHRLHVVWGKKDALPTFISGKLSKNKINGISDIRQYLRENQKQLDSKKIDFTLSKKHTDRLGMTNYSLMQSIQGIPIDGAKFTVTTDKDGYVAVIEGKRYPEATKQFQGNVTPNLSKQEAIQTSWKAIGYLSNAKGLPSTFSQKQASPPQEKASLVIKPDHGTYKLAYHVQLQFIYPKPGNWQIFVNARTGKVIDAYNAIMEDGPATGYGIDLFGNRQTLHTFFTKNAYYLTDTTRPMRGGYIETFTAQQGQSLPGTNVTDASDAFIADWQKAAVSAQTNVGLVYDYYHNTFGRNSYDGNGAILRSIVHYGNQYNNAFWDGNEMVYGDGDGSTFSPLAGSIEVTAHELTHAVTQSTANLQYQGQSGALNESISDTFAYFVHPNNFLIGEAVYTPDRSGDAIRSMSQPSQFGQPENMSQYVNTSSDNGGVHVNSGIPNKAAYLTIESIGKEKAEKIYYRALTTYLGPQSQFSDAKAALLQAAADLYGNGGTEYQAVASAWNQVGVR